MKVCLNVRLVDGPYGGAMQFARFLKEYLEANGVAVVHDLHDDDIDVILHTSPYPFIKDTPVFSMFDAWRYKITHPRTVVVHRVNECDERKGTRYMNRLIMETGKYCDYHIYISRWLKNLFEKSGLTGPCAVIRNGADTRIFNRKRKKPWNGTGKLRLVTHHWGGGALKGHDVYRHIDKLMKDPAFARKYSFTFIGRLPAGTKYENISVIAPLSGRALAQEIKKHHVYVTGSVNEPAGMHHIEGALCGLPLVYRNSGALPEYCEAYGIGFTGTDIENSLEQMRKDYAFYWGRLSDYPHSAEKMALQYCLVMRRLVKRRDEYALHQNSFAKHLHNAWLAMYAQVCQLKTRIRRARDEG